ncbi:MAG: hypothetical protein HC933_02380 [Pleurocapsa sp. SU_196_0]|nr:hypothetical protein [Pleurocapsa sp. SU_196_0]
MSVKPNSSSTAVDALIGKFSGSGVTLELKGGKGSYTGSIFWTGKPYPIKASGNGSRATGQFTVGKQTLSFEAQVNGDALRLTVASKTYALTRVPSTPSPAVTKPSAAPPVSSVAAPTATRTVELREGSRYTGGVRITAKSQGVAFVVPQDFNGNSSGGALILGNGKGIGVIVLPFLGATGTDVVALMSRPLEVATGVTLRPSGAAQVSGNRLTLRYAANTAQGQIIATGIAVFGKGNGVTLFAFSDGSQSAAVDRVASSIASGVTFSTATATPLLERARQLLSGKYLNFFSYSSLPGSTYTGASDQSSSRTWNLCGNGQYTYEGSSENRFTLVNPPGVNGSSFGTSPDRVGVASGGGNANTGRWRLIAVGDNLILLFYAGDGSVDDYLVTNLEKRGGKSPGFWTVRNSSSFGASSVCR